MGSCPCISNKWLSAEVLCCGGSSRSWGWSKLPGSWAASVHMKKTSLILGLVESVFFLEISLIKAE